MQLGYDIYIGKLQDINMDDYEYSFYDAERGYLMVLSDRIPNGKFARVEDGEMSAFIGALTKQERNWFIASWHDVLMKWVDKNQNDASELIDDFLDKFKAELEAERGKAEGKNIGE